MPPKKPELAVVSTDWLADELLSLTGLSGIPHARLVGLVIELVVLGLLFLMLRQVGGRVLRRLTDQLARRGDPRQSSRVRTLMGLIRSIADFVLGFVFLVSILGLIGVNVAAIVGTASVAGLAFGFGSQRLVKDFMTGFFLLLEDQYAVGDTVTIGTVTGTVEEMGMRITQIRDDDGRLHTLGNGDIASVCNHSRGPVGGTLEMAVAAAADPHEAARVLEKPLADASAALGLAEPARVEGITAADAAKTTLRIVFRMAPGQRLTPTLAALRQAARDALSGSGIPLG